MPQGMILTQGPVLTQGQHQVMTQRQIQSMKLLQYSALELQQHISEIQALNPAIEVTSNMEELAGDIFEDSFQSHDEDAPGASGGDAESDEYIQYRQEGITGSRSLYDVLLEQLGDFLERDEAQPLFRGCREVIGNLDDNGFLVATDEEIAKGAEITLDEAADAVRFVQEKLEPAGIGAHDVREALRIQLERKGEKESLPWRIVTEEWEALQNQRLNDIADNLDVELEDVQDALAAISELDPRPGGSLDTTPTQYICPEITVSRKRDGTWDIIPINSSIPTVTISPDYEKMLHDKKLSKDDRQTIGKYIEEGRQLINDLEFRKSTLTRITEALLKMQPGFFEHGFHALRPLGLKDVATALNLDISTISRAVTNKYMQLKSGPVKYKDLFRKRVGVNDMTDIDVKKRMKQLIESEDSGRPYSDQQITELLHREGIAVSRRVVNKYREAMGIPSSQQRKKKR